MYQYQGETKGETQAMNVQPTVEGCPLKDCIFIEIKEGDMVFTLAPFELLTVLRMAL